MKDYIAWSKPAAVCALVLLVSALYVQVGGHDFVSFDDGRYVYDNPVVSKGLSLQGLQWALGFTDIAYWHPVTWLSHMLDCELFGLDPGPPHLVNAFLHLLNTMLVFYLLQKMTGAFWKSLFVAALFALHPLNVESVAWLAERKNLLSTFLGLSSLVAYVAFKRSRQLKTYIAALLLYMLGLMAKPAIVVFPVLMVLMDFWPRGGFATPIASSSDLGPDSGLRRRYFWQGAILEKVPFLLLAVLTAIMASISMTMRDIDIGFEAVPLATRLANGIISINSYLAKLFWPVDLIVFYPYPETISLLSLVLALTTITGISVLALATRRTAPYVAFGWGWFLIALLPMIGIKQAGLWPALADRWAYVPMIGLFVALVWGVEQRFAKTAMPSKGLVLTGLAILGVLAATTFRQVTIWQNSLTLFQHAVQVDPNNDVAHNNLGAAFYQSGKTERALYHFIEALRIQPGYQAAHDNLDACMVSMGYGENLVTKTRQLIGLKPGIPALHYHLGALLEDQADLPNAEASYAQALQMRPEYVQALNALCRVLMIQKKYAQALPMLLQRAAIKPVNAAVYYEIARIYAYSNETQEAMHWLTKSVEKGFNNQAFMDRDTMLDNLREIPSYQHLKQGLTL
jgi:Flp pilus assembly protein TadD